MDVPNVEMAHRETTAPLNPLGLKGVGEAGCIPTGACFAQAIEDALPHLALEIREIPLSPNRLFELLRDAGPADRAATAALGGRGGGRGGLRRPQPGSFLACPLPQMRGRGDKRRGRRLSRWKGGLRAAAPPARTRIRLASRRRKALGEVGGVAGRPRRRRRTRGVTRPDRPKPAIEFSSPRSASYGGGGSAERVRAPAGAARCRCDDALSTRTFVLPHSPHSGSP